MTETAHEQSQEIQYDVRQRVAVITINRPHRKNAMTYRALGEFRATLRRAADDEEVLAVVLTGAGGAFCAGTDLSDLNDTKPEERGGSGDRPSPWMAGSCLKPVVAAIDGPAVGMGADLTTQADLRIASTRARIAWNFVHRGLVPDTGAGSYLLPRQVGLQNALRLVLGGDFIDAQEALRIGYVLDVVEPEVLLERAVELAVSVSRGSPYATREAKALMYDGLGRDAEEHLAAHREALQRCFGSDDHREGVASFLEKREPRFTGH